MSASIPIPGRSSSGDGDISDASLQMQIGGMSLPAAHRSFINPPLRVQVPITSQDDIATSWPPRPSVRLVSRSARKWLSGHRDVSDPGRVPHRASAFEPWDFSEIAMASDQVQSAFRRGSARAERPPREGVCGTYFIRRVESKSSVLCVFKPVDEEAGDLETSPVRIPPNGFSNPHGSDDFSLGPSHSLSIPHQSRSPSDASPPPNGSASRSLGMSSESERGGSRTYKPNPGFHAGEGAYKEVAAYLLDHKRFARVPQTALAMCNFASDVPEKNKSSDTSSNLSQSPPSRTSFDHPVVGVQGTFPSHDEVDRNHLRTKMGAFQVYVENIGDADDFGPGVFCKDQVHRIAALDIRTLNHDRHGGNILVVQSKQRGNRYDLIPIDHGYILPDVVNSIPWPVWMDWSMIREDMSDEVKRYIARLDAETEALILHEELDGKLRPGSLRSLKISTTLLQKGTEAGLTLYEIGLLMYTRRDSPDIKSELEKIIDEAEDAGLARQRHLEEESSSVASSIDGVFVMEDLMHRNSSSLSSALSHRRSEHESYIDDYIVKYAGRRISEVVRRVAENKNGAASSRSVKSGAQRTLARARSIPDFGLGIRPLSAMFTRLAVDSDVAPAPLPSPVDKKRPSLADEIESVTRPPIRIPIDGNISRIPIPALRPAALHVTATAPTSRQNGKTHRRIASERPTKGAMNRVGNDPSDDLLPLFKSSDRKSSPVGPLDIMYWESGSQ